MGNQQDEIALEKRRTQNRLAQRRRRQRRADLEEKRHSNNSVGTDGSCPNARLGRPTSASQSGARQDSAASSSSGNEDNATKHVQPRQLDLDYQKDSSLPGSMYDDIFMGGELDMPLHFESRDARTAARESGNIDPLLRHQNTIKSPASLQNADMYRAPANIHVSASAPEPSMLFDTPLSLSGKDYEPNGPVKSNDRSTQSDRAAGKLARRSQMILHFCAQRGDIKLVELLLDHGAEIDCPDHVGRTALHYAVKHLHQPVVRKLLDWGADTEVADREGLTPLHLAVDAGAEAIVLLLIEQGADLNAAIEY